MRRQLLPHAFTIFQHMNSKVIIALIVLLFICQTSQAQHSTYIRLTRASVQQLRSEGVPVDQVGNPLKIGVSVGYNFISEDLYNVAISPIDNTVQFDKISPATVVLSTAVMFSLRTYYLRQRKDMADPSTATDNTEGRVFVVPSRWSVGAVVNIVQFSAESNLYNQQIDGGLGIGYALNENIFVLASAEFISVKQPRNYFIDQYKDKNSQLIVDGAPVRNFNYDDNNIFMTKYVPSVSLKIVFGLALTKTGNNNGNAQTIAKEADEQSEQRQNDNDQ